MARDRTKTNKPEKPGKRIQSQNRVEARVWKGLRRLPGKMKCHSVFWRERQQLKFALATSAICTKHFFFLTHQKWHRRQRIIRWTHSGQDNVEGRQKRQHCAVLRARKRGCPHLTYTYTEYWSTLNVDKGDTGRHALLCCKQDTALDPLAQ